jgi:hypothetical protein
MNRGGDAMPHFVRAIEIDPSFAPAHYHLGVAYWTGADPELSDAHYTLGIIYPVPYNTLAQVLRQKGDIEGSKAAFAEGAQAKAKIDPQSAEMPRGE